MSYLALYRKWRPATFDEVKGQDAIGRTLRNQIIYDRIAHAYLFSGTRGTGKTSIAKLFAKAVNCQNPQDGNPCGKCRSCLSIADQSSLDVIEIDAASNNGVDNIRQIREQVQYMPLDGHYKVYIIDEVHMLSGGAFNALLKTLEEPPSYVIFILATTEKHKIPVTILSRCQKYDFRRISPETITAHLADLMTREHIQVEEKALRFIARTADGSMRDALSLLDQSIAFYLNEDLTYDKVIDVLGAVDTSVFSQLLKALAEKNILDILTIIDNIIAEGREPVQFLNDFLWYLRNLLLIKDQDHAEDHIDMSADMILKLKEDSRLSGTETLLAYIHSLSVLSGELRYSTQKRILLETGFIRLCRPEMDDNPQALLARMEELEDQLLRLRMNPQAANVSSIQGPSSSADSGKPAGKQPAPALSREAPAISPEEALEERFSPAEARDLKEIAGSWREIVNSMDNPLRRHIRQARISVADDSSRLLLLFDPENLLSDNAKAYFEKNNGENLALLSDFVAKRTGKKPDFSCIMTSPSTKESDNYIDLSKIHTDITYEND